MINPNEKIEKVVDALSTAEIVRSGGLLVAFIFAVMNRKLWYAADLIAAVVFGTFWSLMPQTILGFQINRANLDGIDIHLCRVMGLIILSSAVLWFLVKDTVDKAVVHPSLMLSRVVTCGILLIAQIHAQLFDTHLWTSQHISFGMLGVIVWMAGNLIHLFLGGYVGGHTQRRNAMNGHLLFDFLVTTLVSFTLYGFPEWLKPLTHVRNLDMAHEHLTRAVAGVLMGSGVVSVMATGWAVEADKQAQFLHRMIINVLLLAATIFAQIFYVDWHASHLLIVDTVLVLWTVQAYLGYKAEDLYHVPRKYTRGASTREYTSREYSNRDRDYYSSRSDSPQSLRETSAHLE